MIKLEDKLYTSTEVASILGVSLRSVYRYIEESKLTAEVKTATGRHRFTKQDILDFLYPDGNNEENVREEQKKPTFRAEAPRREVPSQSSSYNSPKESYREESNAEDVDWLSKFRAAAEKFKKEDSRESDTTIHNSASTFSLEKETTPSTNMFFYRSSLGGLKDIAQNLDKSSKEASLDYAFTLNAGLSLHKPIKPFSLLHSYVRSSDLNYFEKLLSLTPSDSDNAQLCLITADSNGIFRDREVLHGLNVVSKTQLKNDVDAMSPDLRSEVSSIN